MDEWGMAVYSNFGDCSKATQRSPLVNFTQWGIPQSKVFSRKGIEKLLDLCEYIST